MAEKEKKEPLAEMPRKLLATLADKQETEQETEQETKDHPKKDEKDDSKRRSRIPARSDDEAARPKPEAKRDRRDAAPTQ